METRFYQGNAINQKNNLNNLETFHSEGSCIHKIVSTNLRFLLHFKHKLLFFKEQSIAKFLKNVHD